MPNYVSLTSNKSKKKAFLICLFFGLLGGHYFYVGRFGRGLLCTCTMNFFMFGWVLDLIRIASGKFQDNVGQYLRG